VTVQWVKVIMLTLMALLMGGCVKSSSQLGKYAPTKTFTSNKPPQEVAKCIEYKIREGIKFLYVVLENYPDQSYHISVASYPGYMALADILVKPSGNGSIVEYRSRRESLTAKEEEMVLVIEGCVR
jgi:hypothetical protein